MDQQFLLDIVLNSKVEEIIDLKKLKTMVKEFSAKVQEDKDMKGNWDQLRDELKAQVVTIDAKKKAAREKIEATKAAEEAKATAAAAAQAQASGAPGTAPGAAPTAQQPPAEGAKK
jgi:peptidoglycan hydrolase CwlO-like protein